jgi:molybdopterin synthase catalytic subunit
MFRVTDEAIDILEVIRAVVRPEAGALITFIGITRNSNEGRRVTSLEYEAYPEMAVEELERLGTETRRRWQISDIAIVHRVGEVEISDPSVVIAVSAPHRQAAFEACRFAIEEIKRVVPIWKKEIFEGGEVWIGTQSGRPFSVSRK